MLLFTNHTQARYSSIPHTPRKTLQPFGPGKAEMRCNQNAVLASWRPVTLPAPHALVVESMPVETAIVIFCLNSAGSSRRKLEGCQTVVALSRGTIHHVIESALRDAVVLNVGGGCSGAALSAHLSRREIV